MLRRQTSILALFLSVLALRAAAHPRPSPVLLDLLRLQGTDSLPEVAAPPGVPVGTGTPAIAAAPNGALIGVDAFFDELGTARIVYAGEQHDLAAHHLVQAEIVRGLHARKPGLAIGLEMVDFTRQDALDDYLAGTTSEAEFAEFWREAWGYDFAIYRPILEYARANGIPVKGLNAPIAVIRKIYKGGLASLTPAERALLPATIHPMRDPDYLDFVNRALDGHGPLPPEVRARMMAAQTVWNETMGEQALKALAASHGPLVVIAGSGHMLFKAGIAESVRNRSGVRQSVVLPYPLDGEAAPLRELLRRLRKTGSKDIRFADYFRLLPG